MNFGAFDTVRTCLGLLEGDGFLLVNDYGPVQAQEVAEFGTASRFGSSIAMGLNFPLLEYIFSTRQFQVSKADGDDQQPIHTRLLSKKDLPGTVHALKENFNNEAWKTQDATVAEARRLGGVGQLAPAMEKFREALAHNPNNWCLLGEIAEFLIGNTVEEGMEFARLALTRNPWYSSWLWNVLGDGFYHHDRFAKAETSYMQAKKVNPKDVVTNFNLSFIYAQAGRFRDSLDSLSTALANDFQGVYRERIVHQQQRIMLELSSRWASDQIRAYQRAATFG